MMLKMKSSSGTPNLQSINEYDDINNDPDYQNEELTTARNLLETGRKGIDTWINFGEYGKNQYLFNLRERNQKFNKHPRIYEERKDELTIV